MLFMEESAGYLRILEKGRIKGVKEVVLPVLKEKFIYLPEKYD